jgi:hypothetical protein
MTVTLNTQRKGVSILWDANGDSSKQVTVFATGEDGDVHNKAPVPNSGEAGLFYPTEFEGSSDIEIRDADGNVLDSGAIAVAA